MTTSGWKALEQWGDDVARIERLTGGVANSVWSVRINGQLAVALSVAEATQISRGRPRRRAVITIGLACLACLTSK